MTIEEIIKLRQKAEQEAIQAEIEDRTNSLHRAKEAFRKEEFRLAEKAEYLLEFEAKLKEKEEKITKAKKEGKK